MKQVNIKKLVILNLPYLLIGLYASKLGQAYRLAAGADLSAKLLHIGDGLRLRSPASIPRIYWWACSAALPCGWPSI